MHFQFRLLLVASAVTACWANADAQTRHVIPNRGLDPANGISTGLGGSSMGLQRSATVQPTTTPKIITITGTYREVKPPSADECKAKETKAMVNKVANSIKSPLVIQFTPEQFEKLAVDLIKDIYVTDASGETLSMGFDLLERDGEIVKTKKAFVLDENKPSTEMLLDQFKKGESFLVLRKTPLETSCGMCEGKGMVKIGEITYDNAIKPTESRFAECTRCHGLKKSTIDVDMAYKVVLKKAE